MAANMLFRIRHRVSTFPNRLLTTTIVRCKYEAAVWGFKRRQLPSCSGYFQSLLCQEPKKKTICCKDNKKASQVSKWTWTQNSQQKGRFLDGLFGYGRYDVLAYLKRSLGPLSVNCPGQHMIPIRYHSIPNQLPSYTPPIDKLGITFTRDLNDEDVLRIKYIAKDLLKKLILENNVKYQRRKSIPSTKDNGVFSTPLPVLVWKDMKLKRIKPKSRIPAVVHLMMSHIYESEKSTNGVFVKQSDEATTKELCKDLQDNFYRNPDYAIDKKYTPVDVAVVMSEFLRQLPDPIVSTYKHDVYPDVCSLSFLDIQLRAMNLFFLVMEPAHRETLRMLLAALNYSVKRNEVSGADLGIRLGPILFKMPDKIGEKDHVRRALEFEELVKVMVHFSDNLFHVPPDILSEVRYQCAMGDKPNKKRLIKLPWKKKPEVLKDADRPTEITVSAPGLTEKSKKISLDAKTTADEVVLKYAGKNRPRPPYLTELKIKLTTMGPRQPLEDPDNEALSLYEVGGNIGERRLHPSTLIQDLYLVNPNAKFVIK